MTLDELDAAVLAMTDTQVMALLARRTAAKAERGRQQAAARMAKMRDRKCYANGDAPVTPSVTQKKRNITSESYANGDAPVTPSVTQNGGDLLPPSPQVSPTPPSFPAPTHGERKTAERGTAEELIEYASERGLPATDGEWLHDKMLTQGWKVDGRPVKDWQALVRVWQKNGYFPSQKPVGQHGRNGTGPPGIPAPAKPNDRTYTDTKL